MKRNRLSLLFILLIAALMLTACSGAITASSWPGLNASGDTVYVAYQGSITAVQVQPGAGNQLWVYPAKPDNRISYYAAPALTDTLVVAGDYTKLLHALNRSNGTEAWTFTGATGRYIGSPLIVGQTIYAPNADGNLYAVDMQGKQLWKFSTQGGGLWAQPASDGKTTIFQPSMDHSIYAIDTQNGQQIWKVDLGGSMVSSPLYDNGTVYITTLTSEMVALNASNGQVVWRVKTKNAIWAKPMLKDGVLYIGDSSGVAYGIDEKTGAINWQQDLAAGSIIGSPALITTGVVFVTENGLVQAIGFNGQKAWNKTINGKLYSDPVIANDRIVLGVVSGAGTLTALDFNGNEAWTYPPPKK